MYCSRDHNFLICCSLHPTHFSSELCAASFLVVRIRIAVDSSQLCNTNRLMVLLVKRFKTCTSLSSNICLKYVFKGDLSSPCAFYHLHDLTRGVKAANQMPGLSHVIIYTCIVNTQQSLQYNMCHYHAVCFTNVTLFSCLIGY